MKKIETKFQCRCGKIQITAIGKPITSVVCYCDDCQNGGKLLNELSSENKVSDMQGGTPYVLFRKDKIIYDFDKNLLKGLKLKSSSPTNRNYSACCLTPMFINFDDNKHWIDFYALNALDVIPKPEMRICTKFKTGPLNNELPNYKNFSLHFISKLIFAKFQMWFF